MTRMRAAWAWTGALLLGGMLGGCAADSEVEVPDVVGQLDVDAWYSLHEAGLDWEAADPDWGNAVVVEGVDWVVSAQDPPAGSVVSRGDVVILTFRQTGASTAEEPAAVVVSPAPSLAAEVEAAFRDSYGWPDEPGWAPIIAFTDRDAPRVTVITDLYPKAENEAEALGICNAVASVSLSVRVDYTGVYVTAGEADRSSRPATPLTSAGRTGRHYPTSMRPLMRSATLASSRCTSTACRLYGGVVGSSM